MGQRHIGHHGHSMDGDFGCACFKPERAEVNILFTILAAIALLVGFKALMAAPPALLFVLIIWIAVIHQKPAKGGK